ncbi:MAG: hypothetical protein ACK5CQ_03000 [Cyanobacteriota bacterium]|jgi:restriction system protein
MGWARTDRMKAGLFDRPRRATYVLSQSGKDLLSNPSAAIDAEFLRSYEQFKAGQWKTFRELPVVRMVASMTT